MPSSLCSLLQYSVEYLLLNTLIPPNRWKPSLNSRRVKNVYNRQSECHTTMKHICFPGSSNDSYYCLECETTTIQGDTQFYSEAECKASCGDKANCTCDGACYVCSINVDPSTLICTVVPYQPGC
uniref:Uncharacterized protein n=1 Tax=Schizaphis graminum TaxID=13262 RepID=A0A2S2P4D6_SCHGA